MYNDDASSYTSKVECCKMILRSNINPMERTMTTYWTNCKTSIYVNTRSVAALNCHKLFHTVSQDMQHNGMAYKGKPKSIVFSTSDLSKTCWRLLTSTPWHHQIVNTCILFRSVDLRYGRSTCILIQSDHNILKRGDVSSKTLDDVLCSVGQISNSQSQTT